MDEVLLTDYPMIDPEIYREVLDGVAGVSVAAVDSADDLVAAAREASADAVVVDATVSVPAWTFDELPDLRVLARSSVGVDGVDLEAAEAAGVPVLHAPDYCVDEVATHAVSLLFACARAVPEYDRAVRAGEWPRTPSRPLHRIHGSTLGLLSYGTIAQAVRERVRGFGMDVVVHDPYVDNEVLDADGVERVGRAELFERADHVSVHAPDTPETRGLVDTDALDRLGPEGILVNVGRGPVVDEAAVATALSEGRIAAAGLDVFGTEPLPEESRLRALENAVLTPHAAWYSEESRASVNHTVATDVRRVLTESEPEYAVGAGWL